MSEMIERVAKAIYLSPIGGREDPCAPRWEDLREKQKDGFRDNARAAIEAMREPTELMKDNDVIDPAYYGRCPTCGGAEQSWPAMIDAALGKVDA